MKEEIVDPRLTTPEESAGYVHQAQILFKLNHTMPYTEEFNALAGELFGHDVFADGGFVMPGLTGICFDRVKLGRGVRIMYNCLMMARGGIIIDDNAMVAANAQLISNNHDLHDRELLICKPVARRDRRRQRRGGRRRRGDQGRGPEHHRGRESGEVYQRNFRKTITNYQYNYGIYQIIQWRRDAPAGLRRFSSKP